MHKVTMREADRRYNVICSDKEKDYPVHIGWTYHLALKLRNDRKKDKPDLDYWISRYSHSEFSNSGKWQRIPGCDAYAYF